MGLVDFIGVITVLVCVILIVRKIYKKDSGCKCGCTDKQSKSH